MAWNLTCIYHLLCLVFGGYSWISSLGNHNFGAHKHPENVAGTLLSTPPGACNSNPWTRKCSLACSWKRSNVRSSVHREARLAVALLRSNDLPGIRSPGDTKHVFAPALQLRFLSYGPSPMKPLTLLRYASPSLSLPRLHARVGAFFVMVAGSRTSSPRSRRTTKRQGNSYS